MKNKYALIITYVFCFAALGLLCFLWFNETKVVEDLQAQTLQVEDELNSARKKQPADRESLKAGTKEEEKRLTAAIPYNEKEPFTFVKILTRLASQANIKNIKFTASTPEKAGARGIIAGGSDQSEGVYSISIQMNAEGEFYQLVNFLKTLSSLDRTVTVDAVQVVRDEKILPCQKISLKIKVYTYLAPDAAL
jgi:Tfp pilus assembly protein PilO